MQSLRNLYKIGRGPSSSHTMGPDFAARDFLKRCPTAARYRVTLYGSLAKTGKGHLTDKAVSDVFRGKAEIVFDPDTEDLPHPNTLDITAFDPAGKKIASERYLSIGGGEIQRVGAPVALKQDIYPFRNFEELRAYCESEHCTLADVAFRFEDADFKTYLQEVWQTMQDTIGRGLNADGELPGGLHVQRKAQLLYKSAEYNLYRIDNRAICSYAFAVAEENAGGGTVVTAPTCGASGVLPAILYDLFKNKHIPENKILSALAAAGLVGNVVKTNGSISGAEAGCQAEIGTATAMAAAAITSSADDPIEVTEYAAEIALEHQLGLTCDPVCGLVQIPCIERNAVAALRAIASADLAHILEGTRKISFDTIVRTMYLTGKDLNAGYRETAEKGLAREFK